MVPSLDHVLRERYLCLYETGRSIVVFIKYRYWTLPFPSELRLLFNIILYMIHCNTIFLPKPRPPKQFIPTGFQTKILDTFFYFPNAYYISGISRPFELIIVTIEGEDKNYEISLCLISSYFIVLPTYVQILSSELCLDMFTMYVFLYSERYKLHAPTYTRIK
jgi:hypothetical protein